nr:P-loop NTPase [Brachybacterium equifaecis]
MVLCASGADEVRIAHDVARDPHRRARIVRRCADLPETLAVAAAGIGDVVLIDIGVRGMDREAAAELARTGTAVVGLRPPDAEPAASAAAMGISAIIDSASPLQELLEACESALAPGAEGDSTAWLENPLEPTEQRGTLVALWGPTGSPGRSTLAVNLAAEVAALGSESILVDADTYGPSLTQVLGVLDEAPGLVAASRAASRGTLDAATIQSLLPLVRERLRLLSGIGVASRWAEVRSASLDLVWSRLLERDAVLFADVAAPLEEDEELSYDTAAPQRNAAALSAVRRADLLLAVVAADPVSITRLVRERERIEELRTGELQVVVNRLGAPVPEARVRELILSHLPASAVHVLPDDPATCRRSAWDGTLLLESAPRSPLRTAIRALAAQISAAHRDRIAP